MYLFKGRTGDLLADIETTMKLPVKSDITVYEIIVNGVACDFCGNKEHPDMAHYYEDQTVCEACYDHFNERWD